MNAWKIFLGLGIVIFAIGLTLFITGLALNGWKFKVEYEMQTFTAAEENSTLDLKISAGSIAVEFYDGENIEVNYPDSVNYGYEVKEKAGTLKVKPVNRLHFNWFGWNDIPTVTVKVPSGKIMNLKLDLSAGAATVASGEYGNVRISMSAGSTTAGDLKCGELITHLSAGKIAVGGAECSSLDVRLSAGVANISDVVCNDIDIDLSAGSAKLSVIGNKSEYTVSVDKSAGSCNLVNQSGTVAGKKIDVDLSAGSVEVTFKD
ncbi:MAG: DUF4097 domain-containing protein [Clostridia bacterium]|nr:DUF4097 domain-containing protein [Clostridia bacterium]